MYDVGTTTSISKIKLIVPKKIQLQVERIK